MVALIVQRCSLMGACMHLLFFLCFLLFNLNFFHLEGLQTISPAAANTAQQPAAPAAAIEVSNKSSDLTAAAAATVEAAVEAAAAAAAEAAAAAAEAAAAAGTVTPDFLAATATSSPSATSPLPSISASATSLPEEAEKGAPIGAPSLGSSLGPPPLGSPLGPPPLRSPLRPPPLGSPLGPPPLGASLGAPPLGSPLGGPPLSPLAAPLGSPLEAPPLGAPLGSPLLGPPLEAPSLGPPLEAPSLGAPLETPSMGASLEGPSMGAPGLPDSDVSGLMSIDEAEAVAAAWPCGEGSRLYFLIANPVSGSRLGARFLNPPPTEALVVGCSLVRVFSQKDAAALQQGLDDLIKSINAKKTLFARRQAAAAAAAAIGGETTAAADAALVPSPSKFTASSAQSAAQSAAAAAAAAAGELVIPSEERVRLVAVGGDGAFNGMMLSAAKAGVDMGWTAAAIIPSGTGNDLAHTYGWNTAPFPTHDPLRKDNLERILKLLEHSDLVFHDYWRVTVVTKEEEGGFSAWCNTAKSVVRLGEDRNGGVRIKSFIMSNYFSIGFEGAVGTQFDKYRGSSRLWNRALYGFLFLAHSNTEPKLCDAVDTIFTFNPQLVALVSNSDMYDQIPGLLPCVSITFLNSRTILGGLELWGPSVKLGLSPPKDPNAYADFEAAAHELLTTKADSGDGKIEVFSMGSTADYVQAQAVRANAIQRVMQGSGPFLLTFKDGIGDMPFQVDGEYFFAHGVGSISVRQYGSFGVLRYRGGL